MMCKKTWGRLRGGGADQKKKKIYIYIYSKPIRNTIFNFNKLVSDLDIHANTPKY